MHCPNCTLVMTDLSYSYTDPNETWSIDYQEYVHEEHFCKDCSIRYLNGEWSIPKEICPTVKQIKCVEFISNMLGLATDNIIVKDQHWAFIHLYLDKAKKEASTLDNYSYAFMLQEDQY